MFYDLSKEKKKVDLEQTYSWNDFRLYSGLEIKIELRKNKDFDLCI